MSEATKPKYFVDGFMIKHFDVWPEGVDKNNLLDAQKVFLMYLMGFIPSHDDWEIQVDYKIKLQEIKDLKTVEMTQEDIDLAKMQGRNIAEIKKERLKSEKEKRIAELNKSFGIKDKKMPDRPQGLPKMDSPKNMAKKKQEKLWTLLQGNGIIKSK